MMHGFPVEPQGSGTSAIESTFILPTCKGFQLGLLWRPKICKFFLLAVILLTVLQLSFNLLFFRNYDSLFIVNGTTEGERGGLLKGMESMFFFHTARPKIVANVLSKSDTESIVEVLSEVGRSPEIDGILLSKLPSLSLDEYNNNSLQHFVNKNESKEKQTSNKNIENLPLCPPVPSNLDGPQKLQRNVPTIEEQEKIHSELEIGGRYRPTECHARSRVAIVIPYRDRITHLAIFLYHMHPILEKQQIDYAIYIMEQAGKGKFNRAMLLNVGFLEALKLYPYDCFIFHDVDLIPEDDRNLYTCPKQPRHMSVAVNTLQYKLPYNDIFGGVSAMTVEQFKTVNGFSNKFWGWGGEDDDMSNRLKYHGYYISRYPSNIARYTMLSHRKGEPNPKRFHFLHQGTHRFKADGLNATKYKVLDIQLRRLYTWIYVDLLPS